jgi:hypothetical protein
VVVRCKAVSAGRDASQWRKSDCDEHQSEQRRRCRRCDEDVRLYLRAVCLVRAIFNGVVGCRVVGKLLL